jgi:hypothetical protein
MTTMTIETIVPTLRPDDDDGEDEVELLPLAEAVCVGNIGRELFAPEAVPFPMEVGEVA